MSRSTRSLRAAPNTANLQTYLQRGADDSLSSIPCPIEDFSCPKKLVRTSAGHVIPALNLSTIIQPHDVPQAALKAYHLLLDKREGDVRIALSGFVCETFETNRQPTAAVFPGVLSPPFASPLSGLSRGNGASAAKSVHVNSLPNSQSLSRDLGLRRSWLVSGRSSRRSSCPGSVGPGTFERRTRTSATPLDLAEGSSSFRPDIASLRARLAAAETEVAATRVALALIEGGFVAHVASGSRRSRC